MALTSIGDQLTPGRPIELTFEAETGLPSGNQRLLMIGHRGAGAASGSAVTYEVNEITNAGDRTAASAEAATKFGEGSELQKMIVAAIDANVGLGTVPPISVIPLSDSDTDFGASDVALTNAQKVPQEFLVSPYDAIAESALLDKLKDHCLLLSGAQRVENGQYGTVGVAANQSVSDPGTLTSPDTEHLCLIWNRDSGPAQTVAEVAAACGARMAANGIPFNPLDDQVVGGLDAPDALADRITVGAGLESESALSKGWTPMRVLPNGDVAFVRTRTSRITVDGLGVVSVTSYYDVQDFQVLYFWRRTQHARVSQPDFKTRKASAEGADDLLSEYIRLANLFEDQQMFQAVDQLAKQFQVERSATDRHRFDARTPVNVIPGLHVIATNIAATTQFDELSL